MAAPGRAGQNNCAEKKQQHFHKILNTEQKSKYHHENAGRQFPGFFPGSEKRSFYHMHKVFFSVGM